jgi:hypothetical protein
VTRAVEVDREQLEAVLRLLADYPELDAPALAGAGGDGAERRSASAAAGGGAATDDRRGGGAGRGEGDHPSRGQALPAAAMSRGGEEEGSR